MKIALSGAFWGMDTTGSGQYLHHLLHGLLELVPAEDCVLFLPRQAPGAAAVCPCPWEVLPTPLDRLGKNPAKLWFEQRAFPQGCRRQGVDVAHVPYFAPPCCPTVPTVVTIHDLIPLLLPAYRGGPLVRGYMRLVSWSARRAALVLTDSHASARDIQRLLHIPPSRLRVIPLAADACYRPLAPEAYRPTLARLGLPVPYMLYLGGFDRRKNLAGLLAAFARARVPGISLVIAGRLPAKDSAFAPDPRPIAQRLGLAGRVHYTGWVAEEDKPALYVGALAFLFPSYYEGFGLPVLEAISCGTPVVVGRGSALEEVAGEGGLAVPPDDVGALAEAITALANDAALRRRLAAQGLIHARRFSWQETARRTLAAYREALGAG